jgi:exonuclease-1
MGISQLLPSLKSIVRTIHVSDAYSGKRVAIDSYCWLHRGAYSCSVELVEGIPTDK